MALGTKENIPPFLQKQTEKLSYLPDLLRAPPRHSLRVWTGRRKMLEERTYPQWRTNSQIKCRFWPAKITNYKITN